MFNLKSIIVLFLFLLSLISTNNIYSCKPKDTEKKVEIGNDVTLCIHAVNLARKVAFKIKVDDYSVISIKEGFKKIVNAIGKDSETENETNMRRLDYRNLVKNDPQTINDLKNEEISNNLPSDIEPQQPSNTPYSETTNILTNEVSNTPTTNPTTNIKDYETQSDNSSDEITEEIKEEFIGQIGNIRTKFPTVS